MATTVQVPPLQVCFKTAGEQVKGIQAVVLHGARAITMPFKFDPQDSSFQHRLLSVPTCSTPGTPLN